jgi:two-component system response regulator YesN
LKTVQNLSFKRKILIYSFIISVFPVILMGMFSSSMAANAVQNEVDSNHRLLLNQIQHDLSDFIKRLQMTSIDIASNASIEKSVISGPCLDYCPEIFEINDMIRKQQSFSSIKFTASILYLRHQYLFSATSRTFEYYNQMIKDTNPLYNSSIMISPNTYPGQKELLLFRPVPIYSDYNQGILVMHIEARELVDFLDSFNLDNESKVFIVDEKGTIIASRDETEIGEQLAGTSDMNKFWNNSDGQRDTYRLQGETYKFSALKSNKNDWTFVAMTPLNLLRENADQVYRFTWIFALSLALMWIVISAIFSKRLYNPIEKILSRVTNMESDSLSLSPKLSDLESLDSYVHDMINMNSNLRNELNEHIPFIKERIFRQLFWGEITSSELVGYIKRFDLKINYPLYYVCLAKVDNYNQFVQNYRGNDRSLIHYALRKLMGEIFEQVESCAVFSPQIGQVAVLIGVNEKNVQLEEKLVEFSDLYRHYINKYFKFSASVAISQAKSEISEGYQEALVVLNNHAILRKNNTFSCTLMDLSSSTSIRYPFQVQKNILNAFFLRDLNETNKQFKQLIEAIPKHAYHSETVMGLFSYFIGELDAYVHELGFDINEFFSESLYKTLHAQETLEDIYTWFTQVVFPEIDANLNVIQQSRQQQIAQKTLLYIHENYKHDINLQFISDQFGISPSHLSRIFKEEANMNFIDYIIEYRMQKATEMLAHTDLPIKDIAESLCYSTVQNFSRIFKQIIGVPPGEYRKQARDENIS